MTDTVAPYPHAPLAEKSILSSMFRNPGNIAKGAAEGIDAEAFHIPSHKVILEGLIKSRDAGHLTDDGEIDLGIFVQGAQMEGLLDRMGGPSEVYKVASYAITMSGWSTWGQQVRECKARRIALEASKAIGEAEDSESAMQAAVSALEAMRRAVTAKTRSINAKDACDDFISSYVSAHKNGDLPGESTGIPEIDVVTGGMKAGELWVVGGQSSSGKSVLMYQVASELLGSGKVVAIFSAELMAREIVGRLLTLRARVKYDSITRPKEVTDIDMRKIRGSLIEMQKTKMWIDASGGQSIDSIASEAERIRDIEGRIDLIVVDYIQIIGGRRNKGDSREQEIASVSGGLKQLAKKMDCPVITGTQLNDDGKVRESRAIKQDADVLIKIEEGSILLEKVRNGKRDVSINLALDGSAQRFRYCSR